MLGDGASGCSTIESAAMAAFPQRGWSGVFEAVAAMGTGAGHLLLRDLADSHVAAIEWPPRL